MDLADLPSCRELILGVMENPRDGGAWWAAAYEVAQSRTHSSRHRGQQEIRHLKSQLSWSFYTNGERIDLPGSQLFLVLAIPAKPGWIT